MRKVRIKATPRTTIQGGAFNQVAPNALPDMYNESPIVTNDSIYPLSKQDIENGIIPNAELEKGEQVTKLDVNGLPAKYTVQGKRHSEGGTLTRLEPNDFVFSDTASMRIKDKDLQKEFGLPESKKGYTPAEISKKWDLQKYRKVLADPNSDKIQIESAEQMIGKYNVLMGKLALVQESMKGFENGIPEIAGAFFATNAVNPMDFLQEGTSSKGQGGMMYAQKGREFRDDTYNYNMEFSNPYLEGAKSGKYMLELPDIYTNKDKAKWSRPELQHKMAGTNLYGDAEVSSNYNDFQRRHAWYLKDNPNFDPENPEDVRKFQETYNSKAKEYGLPQYFKPKGGKGTGVDGKFGEHTWSAPGFNPVQETKAGETTTETKTNSTEITTPDQVHYPDYVPFEYFPQDMANLAAAGMSRIPRMKTFYSPTEFTGVDPYLLTPDYSPIMESANISTQGINAYGSRQKADGSLSAIQGKSARAAADHNLAVANANAGILNNASQVNAQISNANIQLNEQNRMTDFDARQAYAADFTKAKNLKLAHMVGLANNAYSNAVKANMMNEMDNGPYTMFPSLGGRVFMTNPRNMRPSHTKDTSPLMQEYDKWKSQYPDMTPQEIAAILRVKEQPATNQMFDYYNPFDQAGMPYNQ